MGLGPNLNYCEVVWSEVRVKKELNKTLVDIAGLLYIC